MKKLATNSIFRGKMEPNSPIWHEFSTPVAQLIARMCDLVLDWRRILVPNLRIWRLFSLFGRASERMSALLADNSCALAPKKERKDPSWANFHTKLPGMRPTRAILSVKAALRMDIWLEIFFFYLCSRPRSSSSHTRLALATSSSGLAENSTAAGCVVCRARTWASNIKKKS